MASTGGARDVSAVARRARGGKTVQGSPSETIEKLEATIDSLCDALEQSDRERGMLLRSLELLQSLSVAAPLQSNATQNEPPVHVDPKNPVGRQRAATFAGTTAAAGVPKRPVSPQARTISPAGRAVSPVARTISPSRVGGSGLIRPNGDDRRERSGSGPLPPHAHMTYKTLLADNRALLLRLEALTRSSRRSESENERRSRQMQRLITEATTQATSFRDRCLVLEGELGAAKKALSQYQGMASIQTHPVLVGMAEGSVAAALGASNATTGKFSRTTSNYRR